MLAPVYREPKAPVVSCFLAPSISVKHKARSKIGVNISKVICKIANDRFLRWHSKVVEYLRIILQRKVCCSCSDLRHLRSIYLQRRRLPLGPSQGAAGRDEIRQQLTHRNQVLLWCRRLGEGPTTQAFSHRGEVVNRAGCLVTHGS